MNKPNEITESIDLAMDFNAEPTTEMVENQETPKTELELLIEKRQGDFSWTTTYRDLKWLVNQFKANKFTYTGPNEAFMILTAYLGTSHSLGILSEYSSKVDEPISCEMNASVFESLAYFVNKYSGNSIESAERLFRIGLTINKTIVEIRTIDEQINSLNIELSKQEQTEPIQ